MRYSGGLDAAANEEAIAMTTTGNDAAVALAFALDRAEYVEPPAQLLGWL
jgi:hypothetical protein